MPRRLSFEGGRALAHLAVQPRVQLEHQLALQRRKPLHVHLLDDEGGGLGGGHEVLLRSQGVKLARRRAPAVGGAAHLEVDVERSPPELPGLVEGLGDVEARVGAVQELVVVQRVAQDGLRVDLVGQRVQHVGVPHEVDVVGRHEVRVRVLLLEVQEALVAKLARRQELGVLEVGEADLVERRGK